MTGAAYARVRRAVLQQATDGRFGRSVPEVAGLTRLSERSVQRALAALREDDELVPIRPARQHYPAVYELAGALAIEAHLRGRGGHLAAVPEVTPEVTPGAPKSPLSGVTPRGGYRGGHHAHARDHAARQARRRPSARAEGTNPRAKAAAREAMMRHRDAGTVCPDHLAERNGAGICRGCRADQLSAGTG